MILISYTSSSYYRNFEDMLHECCERFDVPHQRYTQYWFQQTDYYGLHKDVADCKRMAGFAIWKPYIILDALENDDLVCYCDASVVFETDPKPFIESVEAIACGDAGQSWRNTGWIKRDAFVYTGCDREEYWLGYQVWAGFMVVRRSARVFLEEMLHWCEDRRIISDDENVCGLPNFPDFFQNRSEQAILSLLCIKYPNIFVRRTSPFHDYTGNYSEWIPWSQRGKS